jgi:hypothetical protein
MAEHGKARATHMTNSARLRIVETRASAAQNGKVSPPRRVSNVEVRTREHLTPSEVEKLMAGAGRLGRHGHRDQTLILLKSCR